MTLVIPVLLGSVRRDRLGLRAARFVVDAVAARGHEAVLVDPMELQLPLLDRMYKEHEPGEAPEVLERLTKLYRRSDGFLVVSAEYNNGIPPALKNLLDYFLEEYFWRPSGIVCYSAGQFGGVRAAMQLRMVLAELGMPSVPSLLPIPRAQQASTKPAIPPRTVPGLTKPGESSSGNLRGTPKLFAHAAPRACPTDVVTAARNGDSSNIWRQESKAFFFEKKKQKTFMTAVGPG